MEIAKWPASHVKQANDSFQAIDDEKERRQSPELNAILENDIASSDVLQQYAFRTHEMLESVIAEFEVEGLQTAVRCTKQQSS